MDKRLNRKLNSLIILWMISSLLFIFLILNINKQKVGSTTVVKQVGEQGIQGRIGDSGLNGKNGKDGVSIVGPIGLPGTNGALTQLLQPVVIQGTPGQPGNDGVQGERGESPEIRKDPATGNIESKYPSDDGWKILIKKCEYSNCERSDASTQ